MMTTTTRSEYTYPETPLSDAQADALTVEQLTVELDVMIYVATAQDAA